jgi:hypothetical protein
MPASEVRNEGPQRGTSVDAVVEAAASDCELMLPPPSQPARVSTSASARTVPAGCGSDDLTAARYL